jgi:hypothetical protein
MTPTEIQLLATLKGPVVPLYEICDKWLNMKPQTAREAAALNNLPFPTFRISDSRSAPLLVSVHDLADHIDARYATAKEGWTRSQV